MVTPNLCSRIVLRVLAFALVVLALPSCRVREAPESIDSLARWYWVNYDDLTDEEVLDGVQNLDAEVTTLLRQDKMPLKAKLEDLNMEDIAHLPLPPGTNPAVAQGLVVVTTMPCTLEQVEAIFIDDDFASLFPDVYDSYKREYLTSFDDYVSRTSSELSWTTTYQATLIGDPYTSEVSGEARWVPTMDREEGPPGPALISRSVLMKPASFGSDSNKSMPQDYQIDLYYERSPGEVVHMFAVWRQMNVGTLSTDDDILVNVMLANFVEWDQRMSKLCGS